MEPEFPKSWKIKSKPHKFCPGCGQALALKILGFAVDELNIQDKSIYATDIGCSLLSWNMFDIDTLQTHHGRAIPVISGFKFAKPSAICFTVIGDGGGYAIGLGQLMNAALRNDKITVFLINNVNFAMTGGQLAPTTLIGQKTMTTPIGRKINQGKNLKGPELLASFVSDDAYIARTVSNDFEKTLNIFKKALQNQIDGRGFSFVEVLGMCPTNWHTDALESINYVEQDLIKEYPVGEFKVPEALK